MNEVLVSIIIPAYKTEKYVERSIQSALDQRYPAKELILVDDGSPDRCPEILEEYASKYENVRVCHQKNQGLGIARNTGLDASSGKYVFFLDSDDCLDGEDAIGYLVEEAEKSGADVTLGNYRKFQEDKIFDVNKHHLRAGDYTRTADFRFEGFYRYGHLAYNWGKLYRRAFLMDNDLKCRAYPFTQDKAHNLLCYSYQPKYAFVDESVYLYRINEESVTFRYKENLMPVWIAIASDFHEELKKRGMEDSCRDVTALHVFFGSFFVVKQELMAGKGILKATKVVKEYAGDPFVKKAMGELARGKYLKDISCFSWKVMIRSASILFALHGYFPFTLGIAMLRGMRIDGFISNKRNRRRQKQDTSKESGSGEALPREVQCLCKLLAAALTGKANLEEEKELFKETNGDELLMMAGQHCVLPMLYDVLENVQEQASPELMKRAQYHTERTVKQSYRLLFLTKELVEILRTEEISTVVLKGCSVAAYYPVPEYRKSGDIDLLFENMEEVRRAGKVLEKYNYFFKEEQHANHHLVYQGPEGIDVELHAMLAEPFDDERINHRMEELMGSYLEAREELVTLGVQIPVPSKPLQALELLLHMLQHFLRAGFGLKLLSDWVVFWNRVKDGETAARFVKLAEECGVTGFAKAVTLLCEKYLGLTEIRLYGEELETEFSKGYAERFLMDVINAEEFGKSDKNRMVALRKKGFFSYVKEFHYQMRMNYPEESRAKWKWPYLWVKTFVIFLKNNRRLGRGTVRNILKSAGDRASVVEEMRLFSREK